MQSHADLSITYQPSANNVHLRIEPDPIEVKQEEPILRHISQSVLFPKTLLDCACDTCA